MEGLFFAVKPVWWVDPVHFSSIVYAIIVSIILGFFLWRKNQMHKRINIEKNHYIYSPISIDDREYSIKTLIEIKKYLTERYLPAHSWAHTSIDITSYNQDRELNHIIHALEESQYAQTILDKDERMSINTYLQEKLRF